MSNIDGATWEDKFRFVKEYIQWIIEQIDDLVLKKMPLGDFPIDRAKKDLLELILKRIEEIERAKTSTENIPDTVAMLDRKTETLLGWFVGLEKRVMNLEHILKSIGRTINE
jgi:hypothetical protein